MKRWLNVATVLGIVGMGGWLWGREAGWVTALDQAAIPVAVTSALHRAYPKAAAVIWTREGAAYEAEFADGQTRWKTWIMLSPAGQITETERQIPPAQLPGPVRQRLTTHYVAYQVSEAAVLVRGRDTLYEAELARTGRAHDLYMRADGTEVPHPETGD